MFGRADESFMMLSQSCQLPRWSSLVSSSIPPSAREASSSSQSVSTRLQCRSRASRQRGRVLLQTRPRPAYTQASPGQKSPFSDSTNERCRRPQRLLYLALTKPIKLISETNRLDTFGICPRLQLPCFPSISSTTRIVGSAHLQYLTER